MNKWQKISVIMMVLGVWFAMIGVYYEFDTIRFLGNAAVGAGIGFLIMEKFYKNEN